MKRILIIGLCLLLTSISFGQERQQIRASAPKDTLAPDSIVADKRWETSHLQNKYLSPYYGYGWGLHQGLNVSIDLSAFATFGKHVPHRGGFTERLEATYLAPLTEKLYAAVGGYIQNTNWGGDSYRDGGVYGVLGYRFNDHWEAYLYGQKSLVNNYVSYAGYPYGLGYGTWGWAPGYNGMYGPAGADRIGAAVKYNFNPNFSISVAVEGVWMNRKDHPYFDQYNYPVPKYE